MSWDPAQTFQLTFPCLSRARSPALAWRCPALLPADASPACCRSALACRRMHAHTLYACSSSGGVSLNTCHFYYFSSRGFPAHACPETRSALLPTQAGLQSGRRPSPSVPAEATGLLAWHGVSAWLCGSWCQGFQPVQRALIQPAPATLPCRQGCQCSDAGSTVKLARRMSLLLGWGHKAPGSHPGWDPGGRLARSRQ